MSNENLQKLLQRLKEQDGEIGAVKKELSAELTRLGFEHWPFPPFHEPIPADPNERYVDIRSSRVNDENILILEVHQQVSCSDIDCDGRDCDGYHVIAVEASPTEIISALVAYRQRQIAEKDAEIRKYEDLTAALKEV